jgi:putative ABC transport system permease protein
VLALGIGGHSFQLSMLLAVIKRPPPGLSEDVPLVRLRGMYRAKNETDWHDRALWYAEVREIEALPKTFAAVAAWTPGRVVGNVPGALDDATVHVHFVTDGYFPTLGIRVTHGPGLPTGAQGDRPQLVGVISYAMWEDVFNRAEITDRTVRLNGIAVRIGGVAPPAFTGALAVENRRMMWLPLASRATVIRTPDSSAYASLDSAYFYVAGRLRPGVTPERATAAARVVSSRVAARVVPPPPPGATTSYVYGSDVVPLRGITAVESDMPLILTIWTVLTMLVLLVVCTNVSGLVISAAVGRRQEIAIRLSLGASRGRVIRQLLTESVLLSLTGAALGLLVFRAIIAAMSHIPEVDRIKPDLETVGFTMLVATGTGILFGLAPAFHATRRGFAEVLKSTEQGATRRSRMHQAFVVAQIVLTQPLLVLIASMVGEMMVNDRASLPAGIPDHVLQIEVDMWSIPGSAADRSAALARLVRRISATPGVVQVVPGPDPLRSATLTVRTEDRGPVERANDPIKVDMMLTKQGYFELLGVPLLRGNDLPPADTGRTAIISSDLARALWGNADPIGRRFRQTLPTPLPNDFVVTGVYDSRHLPSGAERARIYRSVKDWPARSYLIRTAGPATSLVDTLRRIAREELPSAPIEQALTLAQIDAKRTKSAQTARLAAAGCAVLVLLLASIGLYGIVALSVGQRRREIGVRMALGAQPGQVIGLFYRSGVTLGAVGLFIGLPISLLAARLLPRMAEQGGNSNFHAPNLVIVGAVVGGVVLVVASVATLIPASRAATVNPVTALRAE